MQDANARKKNEPPQSTQARLTPEQARDTYEWLDPLLKDERFQRFMAWVQAGIKSCAEEALDVRKPMEERDRMAQRHTALKSVAEWPQIQLQLALAVLREPRRIEQQVKHPGL